MMPYQSKPVGDEGTMISPMSASALFSAVLSLDAGIIIVPSTAAASCGGIGVLTPSVARSFANMLGAHVGALCRWVRDWHANANTPASERTREFADDINGQRWSWTITQDVLEARHENTCLRFSSAFGIDPEEVEVLLAALSLALRTRCP